MRVDKMIKLVDLGKSIVEIQRAIEFWQGLLEDYVGDEDINLIMEIIITLQDTLRDFKTELGELIHDGLGWNDRWTTGSLY